MKQDTRKELHEKKKKKLKDHKYIYEKIKRKKEERG